MDGGEVVSTADYVDHKLVSPNDGSTRIFAYAENVTLDPGEYSLEVVLYYVPAGYDMTKLHDQKMTPTTRPGHLAWQGFYRVKIAP